MKPDILTHKVMKHHRAQFGVVSVHQILSKLMEECGEVAADVTRWTEGRYVPEGQPPYDTQALSEIGDVLIVLTALCGYLGSDIDEVKNRAAREFLDRTWDIKTKVS